MRSRVVGLVTAAALLASVGIANAEENTAAKAKGPVTLTDNQLDKVTAGGSPGFGCRRRDRGSSQFCGGD